MKALVVPPPHPSSVARSTCAFDLRGGAPGLASADQFGFVERVDGFGYRFVVRIPDGPGRGDHAEFHDSIRLSHGHVVGTVVRVVGRSGQVSAGVEGCHVQCLQWQDVGLQRRCGVLSGVPSSVPSDVPPRVDIGAERDVGEALPGAHVGDVDHPESARCVSAKAALHEIRRAGAAKIGPV